MDIDYKAIGRRVRTARLKANLTQEQLAECAELSLPHVSNIETGNTKLSLPTLLCLANILSVSADQLLCDSLQTSNHAFCAEAQEILSDCTNAELRVLVDILKISKQSIRQHILER